MLEDAIRLIEADQLYDAREIIVDVLYKDYDNLEAWLLLTKCAIDREEYTRAVREVLRIDPENVKARRLAVEMARKTAETGDIGRAIRSSSKRTARSVVNTILVTVIIVLGAILAIVLIYHNEESATLAQVTTDPIVACTEDINTILTRVQAACGFVEKNELCLGSQPVYFEYAQIVNEINIRGDHTRITNIRSFNTAPYAPLEWGLVVMRGQTSFPDSTNDSVLFSVTGGGRVYNIEENLRSFTFSSNPVVSSCPSIPPAGLLMSITLDKEARFEVNELDITLSGTAFMQVDTAAGLVLVTLNGQTILDNRQESRLVQAGQWIRWPVDAQFKVRLESGTVMVSGNSVRGDLSQLIPVGEALGLDAEQSWKLPDEGPALAFIPSPTVTTSSTFTTTPTAISTEIPTRTPTPIPPDIATELPVLATLPLQETSPTSSQTPTLTASVTPRSGSDEQRILGAWQCVLQTNDGSFSYQLTFDNIDENQLQASSATINDTVVTLEGEWIDNQADLDDNWAEVPGYRSGEGWIVLQEGDSGSTGLRRVLRLFLYNNQIEGALFDDAQVVGQFIGCEKQN